MFSKWKWS